MHLAAETHVDNSIDDPSKFIETNIFGTYNLLMVSNEYYKNHSINKNFRQNTRPKGGVGKRRF